MGRYIPARCTEPGFVSGAQSLCGRLAPKHKYELLAVTDVLCTWQGLRWLNGEG